LVTLAHEYGHFRSWKDAGDGATSEYRAYKQAIAIRPMTPDAFSAKQKRMILEEEERAWAYGRSALEELEFDDWPDFLRHRDESLQQYRTRLGIEQEPTS
jgi:hypothetical protein